MTQALLERTVREWVEVNPTRGARELDRLAPRSMFNAGQSVEEIADALIKLAGRMEIAETRAW